MYLEKELIAQIERRLSYEYKGSDGEVQCECYGSCTEDLFDRLKKYQGEKLYTNLMIYNLKKFVALLVEET